MTEENQTPETTPEPEIKVVEKNAEPVKSFRLTSTKPVVKPWLSFKMGFSFGFFAFIISPIILFQSVLFFLFLLVLEPTKGEATTEALGNLNFLLSISQLLFFSILLFIGINLLVATLGVLFDKRRGWAIMALVLTSVSLGLIFIAPRLIEWQTSFSNFF